MFWKEVKRARKGECGRKEMLKGIDGQLPVDEIKVRKRWAEYFKNLLNEEDDRDADIMVVENEWRMPVLGDENDRDITKVEVRLALRATKAGQAPGIDERHSECLSNGGLIDHGHHGNKAIKALTETLEMDEAVEIAKKMTNPSDTLIVVTADHSHTMTINGYPSRHTDILGLGDYSDEDYMPFTTILYGNGPGYRPSVNGHRPDPSEDDLHDVNYRQAGAVPINSAAHAGEDVGLWATGPFSHLFTGVYEQNYIPHALAYAACVGNGLTFCGNNNSGFNRRTRSRGTRRWNL
ncbi:hypothetical protein SK128_002164 [Halocaridina rubra]|uniref:alkaline phosphatase n=1 Tax=Halocaridina rubra TaxID=373956 RepID=A0AAN8X3D1_HALRR